MAQYHCLADGFEELLQEGIQVCGRYFLLRLEGVKILVGHVEGPRRRCHLNCLFFRQRVEPSVQHCGSTLCFQFWRSAGHALCGVGQRWYVSVDEHPYHG